MFGSCTHPNVPDRVDEYVLLSPIHPTVVTIRDFTKNLAAVSDVMGALQSEATIGPAAGNAQLVTISYVNVQRQKTMTSEGTSRPDRYHQVARH